MTVPASPLVVQGQQRPPRRRIGRTPRIGQPKLFGGSIEEYVEVTGKEIPLIVKSCIRVINLYGKPFHLTPLVRNSSDCGLNNAI